MKSKVAAFSIAVSTLLLAPARAAEPVEILGAGMVPCSRWIEQRALESRNSSASPTLNSTTWMQGFLTGVNTMRIGLRASSLDLPDTFELQVLMDKACRANPKDNLAGVGVAIVKALAK
jgi:hypothetical protein